MRKLLFLAALLLAVLAAAPAGADLVRRKDGSIIEGEIVESTDSYVKISVTRGSSRVVVKIPRREIASVERKEIDALAVEREGYAFLADGEFDQAAASFGRLADKFPNEARYRADLAFALQLGREYPRAEYNLKEAVRLDPDEPVYRANLGVIYREMRDLPAAIEPLEEYYKMTDKTLRACKLLGLTFMQMGNYSEAIGKYEEALEQAPADADVNLALGCLHERSGDYEPARKRYLRLTGLLENPADAWLMLASLERRARKYEEAGRCLRKALESSSGRNADRIRAGLEVNNYFAHVKKSGTVAGGDKVLGVKIHADADVVEVEKLVERWEEAAPEFAGGRIVLGRIRLAKKDYAAAARAFGEALGRALFEEYDAAGALFPAARFLAGKAGDPTVELKDDYLGVGFDPSLDWRDVLKKAELTHALAPEFTDALYVKAVALSFLERFDEAEKLFDQILKKRPAYGVKIEQARENLEKLRREWRRKKGH